MSEKRETVGQKKTGKVAREGMPDTCWRQGRFSMRGRQIDRENEETRAMVEQRVAVTRKI